MVKQLGVDVTDVQVKKTKDGKARLFGFVGLKTNKDAKHVRGALNSTYIDTSKVSVDFAKPAGDAELPRPWSKYSHGSSAWNKQHGSGVVTNGMDEDTAMDDAETPKKSDAWSKLRDEQKKILAAKNAEQSELSEFMQLTKARGAQRLWANDDGVGDAASNLQRRGQHTRGREKGAVVKQQAVASRKPGGEGLLLTKTHVAFEDDSAESDDEYADLELKETSSSERADEPGASSALDWLKAKTRTDFDDDDDDDDDRCRKKESIRPNAITDPVTAVEAAVADVLPKPVPKAKQRSSSKKPSADADAEPAPAAKEVRWKHGGEGGDADAEPIEESGRLFVRNLNFSVTPDELEELFKAYGEIAEIHLPVDTKASKAKGFAFVAYMMPECAKEAAARLDKTIFQGRLLHILPAKALPKKEDADAETDALSYKQKKKAENKKKAADSTNWNTLYMRADAVADSVAARFAMDKASFLDPQGENVAVRLALAETHLIDETKKCFVDQGVDLDVLEGKKKGAKRSATVILVKNIPFSTTAAELRTLFGKFGEIARLVLPPARTIALVEFAEQNR